MFFKRHKDQIQETNSTKPSRLLYGLRKTREILTTDIRNLLQGKKEIDELTLEELETRLLMADVGIETTQTVLDQLSKQLSYGQNDQVENLLQILSSILIAQLNHGVETLQLNTANKPFSVLIVGINGSGKTTSIGKLTRQFQNQGLSVMLAAGDTFRAAAVEQLQTWGNRNKVPVIAQNSGADPASVIYDALQSAKARKIDILLADTAGRLHTQDGLMDELKKIKRVMTKLDTEAPQETWLVIDASIGQNGLRQAEEFHKAIGLTGLIVTKLDGTAKGGIVFAIHKQLGLPVRFIGVGESIDDLQSFNAHEFVHALLSVDEPA